MTPDQEQLAQEVEDALQDVEQLLRVRLQEALATRVGAPPNLPEIQGLIRRTFDEFPPAMRVGKVPKHVTVKSSPEGMMHINVVWGDPDG